MRQNDRLPIFFPAKTAAFLFIILVLVTGARSQTPPPDILYEWCLSDTDCAEYYYQIPNPNKGYFFYMLKTHMNYPRTLEEIQAVVDEAVSDNVLKALWIGKMLSVTGNNVHICPDNEHFVVDPETKIGNCVCLPDRSCATVNIDYSHITIIGILTLVIVLGSTLFNIINTETIISLASRRDRSFGTRYFHLSVD